MTAKELAYIVKDKAVCDSRMVADKLANGKHARVKNVIIKLIKRHEDFKGKQHLPLNKYEPIWVLKESSYRNQNFTYYEMNKTAFSLVAMRFQTDEAYSWQLQFIDTFQEMERVLLQTDYNKLNLFWQRQRKQCKLVRKSETDTIKEFVDLATFQGSKNAKFYYKHITNAVYKCLQLIQYKKPKIRETLDELELNQLMLAETVAERSLIKHMAEGEHYKTIFSLVKLDLEKFAEGLMLPEIKKKEIE